MELRTEIKRRLRATRDWLALIEELEREADELPSTEARSERLCDIAEVCEEVLLRKDKAMVGYQRAFKLHPQNLRALVRARTIYGQMGNLEMVAKLLELELRVAPDDTARARAAAALGGVLLHLGQVDRARLLLEQAAELPEVGEGSDVAEALAVLGDHEGDWLAAVERYLAEADGAHSAEAARLALRAARLCMLELPGDPMYERALRLVIANDPQNAAANSLLEGLLARGDRLDEIAKLHDQRAYAAAEDGERAALYRRFAEEWAVRFHDRERSAGFYRKALEAVYQSDPTTFPGHIAAFGFLREVLGERGDWAALADLADLGLRAPLGDEDRLLLAIDAGVISWKQLGDAERARRFFDRVAAIDPDVVELKEFIAEAGPGNGVHAIASASTAGAPLDAAAAAAAAGGGTAPASQADEPGAAAADAPDGGAADEPRVDEARATGPEVEAVAEVGPETEPEPAARAAAPEAPAAADPGGDEVPAEVRPALEAARALAAQTPERGVDAYRKLLAQAPALRVARGELGALYRRLERWNALVELLKEDADKVLVDRPDERVKVLFELVAIYKERLRLDVMVINTFNQILQISPGNGDALEALATQYEAMKRWPDLIGALQKRVALTYQVADKIALHLRIAALFQEKFSNVAEAIKAYEAVLELDPTNVQAIGYLKESYGKRRDWEKLIGVHLKEIDLISDGDARSERLLEVAKLASEKLKKPAVSIDLWQRVLEADPTNLDGLGELEKLFEREKQWDDLARICEKQALLFEDAPRKVAVLQKLGILYGDKLNDATRATRAWRALLEAEPDNRRAQDAIKKLYLAQRAWDDLEQFYGAQGKLDEFVRVLERQVDAEDESTRLQLYFRIGALYRDKLEKADRAARAFENVLKLDERNAEAAEALVPLYEAAADNRKLVGVLEIQLGHTREDAPRPERMRRLAELSERALRDKAAGFGWYLRAFEEDCHADWARLEAERLAAELSTFAELVAAYEAAYEKFADPARALPLYATVARIYEEELGEPARAIATNVRVLEIDGGHAAAIAALERLYLATERWADLLAIYDRQIDLATSAGARREVRYKVALVHEERTGDAERAIATYRAILDEKDDDLPALRALGRIYRDARRFTELAPLLERELTLVGAEDRPALVDLKHRLGQLRETALDDLPGAIDCYRDILELEPTHAGAREALERRLGDPAHQLTVAAILEPIYQRLEDWPRLIEVFEIQLARELATGARVTLLLRIGELQAERIGDGERALDAYARCFKEDATVAKARAELERLAAIQDAWAPLVALFEAAVEAGGLGGALTHELVLKIAQAYDDKLEKADRAIEFYRRAQALEPDDAVALEALEKLFTRSEQWTELLDVYRRKVELAQAPDEREQLFFRMAYLWEEMLGNVEEAIATYKEVLAQDDANAKALRCLDRLYQVQRAWHELADNLSRQLALTEERADEIQLTVRLAALRERELGETAGAIDTYRRALELDPAQEEATGALERLLALEDHELQVAQILEPLYQARDEWRKLIGVYEIMVRHALDPARKIELLHRIAGLYEIAGDDGAAAFQTYARALREDPAGAESQVKLERLARELTRFSDVVALYGEVVGGVADEELKVALFTKIARIDEAELGRLDDAAAAYDQVLLVDPRNLAAANALEQIYLRQDAYPKLVEVALRKAEIVAAPEDKKELLFKAAQIYEDVLEDAERAIDVYRQVLGLDENDPLAIESLERLYIRLERWDSLKDIYAKKAELAQTVVEKKQMYFVLGQVYDRELRDPARAIETYQTILDLDADDFEAIQALDRLFAQERRWYDLLAILEREVELAQSSGETVALKHRIGRLWEAELGDLGRAVEAYREVLGIDPAHEPTLQALDAILRGPGEPVLAAQVLEPIFRTACEWERLIDVTEVMVKHAEEPARRIELLHEIARLFEREVGDPPRAFEAQARALREDAAQERTLAEIERLAGATGAWAPLAELYEAEIAKLLDPARQVDALRRAARVYEEELARPAEAIATFRRILDADPEQREAIGALDRLYEAGAMWSDLAEVLRKEIRLARTDDEIVTLQFRLGQLFEQRLTDVRQAVEAYREILAARPDHGPTRQALELLFADGHLQVEIGEILEPLYKSGEEWDRLSRIYEVQLESLTGPAERQQMLQRLGELAEQRLDDAAAAARWWGRALSEEPTSELAQAELERLAGVAGEWPHVAEVYLGVLEAREDGAIRRRVYLQLARVLDVELRERQRAIDTYLLALDIDENDEQALAALDRIYDELGMWSELSLILRRRIRNTTATDELVELQHRLGTVFAEALEEPERAVGCYEAILEHDSRNRRALEALERIYFRRDEWAKLFAVYEKLVDVADGDPELAEVYARMAKIASDALADLPRAQDLWQGVIELRGEDPVALRELASLYERTESWKELTEVLDRAVKIAPEPAAQARIYKQLGRVYGDKLQRERDALAAWLQAIELEPGDVEALYALAALYRATQAWEELSETLHRLIELGVTTMEDPELKELYAQLGELQGEILMRPQEAIDAWRRVLEIDGRDFRALAALEALFTREARWEDCIDVLRRRAGALDDPAERIDVLLQAASIFDDKLDEKARAAELYDEILGIDPANLTASLQLEEIHREARRWEPLIELLLGRVEHTEAAADRIEILQGVARIYEQELKQQDMAFVALQAAFKYDYSNDATAREIERLAAATGKWTDLLTEYTQVVQQLSETDPSAAADLWVKIGRWYGDELGHVDYAIASAQQALALEPTHVGALGALADFFRKSKRWPELVAILARHAEVEEDPPRKVELLLGMAELWETQLGDPNQAIAAYRQALEADDRCLDAIGSLERLYTKYQMWPELIDALSRKAAVVDDTEQVITLKSRIGKLYDAQLGDARRSIEAYKDILTVDPQHVPSLKALEGLYERIGQTEDYLDVLEQQLDVSGTDDERISLYRRMAVAWEEQFHKPERAWECFEKILDIDPANEDGYTSLERLYRQERRWEELVDTYRRHINATNEDDLRVELYGTMGAVYEGDLRAPERAIEAYTDVLSFDPDHADAHRHLARLYEGLEDWEKAVDVMNRLIEIVDRGPEQVELHHRVGRLLEEKIGDPDGAEERYVQALAIDGTFVPAMGALTALYKRRGDWLKAAQMMVRAEQHAQNPLEQTRLLAEAGAIYQQKLEDEPRAAELYARTLEIDPEHVEAGEPLAELYFREERYDALEPILDMLVRKADRKDPRELLTLYYRLARTSDELDRPDKALRYYKAAYDLDSTHLPTLIGRAALLYKQQDWDAAFKIYQTILVHHRDSQKEADIVEIFFRLGQIKLRLGERKKALNMFEKALEVDPQHRDTLLSVIELQSSQNDWEAVIHAKRSLLGAADVDERVKLNEEIGDTYRERLSNQAKAIAAYLDALEARPDSHVVMHKLLELYTETKQWKKAIEVVERLAAVEKSPKIRAKYLYTAAVITRDEVKELDAAMELFNRALDDDLELLKAFEALDRLCTARKDWKNLERNYRKMIKRIPQEPGPQDGLKSTLWHNLGEIYRTRLKDYQSAVAAFEVATSLDPGNTQRHEILAELYVMAGPEHATKAIREHQTLIKNSPFKIESYKALRKIYMDTRQYDKAWCVCSTLAFLKKADAEEQAFYEQYRQKGFVRAKQRLTDDLWAKYLFHADEDRYIGAIFSAVWQAVALLKAQPHKNFGLKRKDKRDLATDQLLFSKVFNYVNQVLNVTQPELYLRPEQPVGLQLANAQEKNQLIPSFVVGSDLLQGRPEKELAFAIAKNLSYLRPEHYLRIAVPTVSELKIVLLSALKMVNPKFPVKGDAGVVEQYVQAIGRTIQPAWLEQLAIVVNRFIQTKAEVDLNKWSNAVDLTLHRAGFVLCNDLEVAAKMVSTEPVTVGGAQPKDKVKELVLFSISEEYFAVRQHLGLGIGQ